MKLGEFKDLARGGIAGQPLVSKRKVKGRVFETGSLEVNGLPMEDDPDMYVSIEKPDLGKRDGGGMEASRAKIDEWPSLPDELPGFKPGEVAKLRTDTRRISDEELAKLFGKTLDDTPTKRKAMVVRPDLPRLDVRTLPLPTLETSTKMAASRAKLAADTGEVDE